MAVQPMTESTGAGWQDKELAGGVTIQVTGDGIAAPLASAPAATAWYLPKRPQLLRDRDGRPVFSLTLILERQPGPEDVSIAPLVQQGVLSIGLSLALPLVAGAVLAVRL